MKIPDATYRRAEAEVAERFHVLHRLNASLEMYFQWRPDDLVRETAKRMYLQDCLQTLAQAALYALRVGYKADDCGDHCHNDCYWCTLRRAAVAGIEAMPVEVPACGVCGFPLHQHKRPNDPCPTFWESK